MSEIAPTLKKIQKRQIAIHGRIDIINKQLEETTEQNNQDLEQQLNDLQEKYNDQRDSFNEIRNSVTHMIQNRVNNENRSKWGKFLDWNNLHGNTIATYASLIVGVVSLWATFRSSEGNTSASPVST
jgi:hypothetical protein